jgi:hypothetical protein
MMAKHGIVVALMVLGCLLSSAASVSAEDFRVEASVDRRGVGKGETLALTLTVYGADRVSEPDLSVIEGFQVIGSSSSRNISIVNMKMSRSLNLQYTLLAVQEGEYVLGPFTVKAGDETYDTEPIKVAVTAAQGSLQRPPSGRQTQGQADDDLVLLTASVDRTRAYVGQQITYTLEFAYRVRLLEDTQYIPPDHTGFWFEDLGESGPAIETIDGVRYYVITKRTAFFPISSGRFTIGEAGIRYIAGSLDPFSRDPFSLFGRDPLGAFGRRQGAAKSEPIGIEVLPLPEVGKPADFSGAVGRFDLSVSPSAKEVGVGESLTLSLRVRGRGNIKSIGDIALPEFNDFRVFAPKARESLNTEGGFVGGEKVFDLVLVPQNPGDYRLGGFRFSYFDPTSETYAVSTAEPLLIAVLPGEETAGIAPGDKLDRRVARKDIRYIRRGTVSINELTLGLEGFDGVMLRYLPVVLIFTAVVVSLHRRRSAVTGRASARRAFKRFGKHTKAAERLLDADKAVGDAAAALSKAIKGYLAARCAVPESAVDEALIGSTAELAPETRDELKSLISDLDRIRFAPVTTDAEQVKRLIGAARDLLIRVDKELKE